ncbi:AAA family ATPase [Streptomyces sp. NPDC050658]|uniref:ATP-binding protein n=1 Tax=unclassified Streptomyces TaxID=2593676 RepID=UPI00343C2B56
MSKHVGKAPAPAAQPSGSPYDPVGRDGELAALAELTARHRLVTVTGRAGVGKSLLAGVTAQSAAGPWRRVIHVRWRGLGPAAPGTLAEAVCQAAAAPRTRRRAVSGRSARSRTAADVVAALRRRPVADTLLFLDDIDPAHAQCAGLVQLLLMALPELRVLVTSRRALGLGEEQVLRLEPLGAGAVPGARAHSPAVELFLGRARAVVDGFGAAEDELRAVQEICRTLEGLPLAIELAARQLAHLPVGVLATMLRHDQCWLTGGPTPERRHRSLRDALDAGLELCTRETRTVWARASTFAGAFNEASAVFLCSGGDVRAQDVPACLAELAATGVLETVRDPGGVRQPRYRMVRAARDFGAERLQAAGEFAAAVRRRAAHCRQVALVAENLWTSGCQAQAFELVQEEQEEIDAALRHALSAADDDEMALETVVNLWFWWAVHGRTEEGRDLLLHLLPHCASDSPLVTRARWLAAWLCAPGDPEAGRTLLGAAWTAAVLAGDDATVGRIAHVQGMLCLYADEPRTAVEFFHEAARVIPAHAPGGPSPALSLAALAVAQAAHAPRAARRTARRALARPGIQGDAWACAVARYAAAYVDYSAGRPGRARRRAQRTLAALAYGVPMPHVRAALRQLVADIEAGLPPRVHPPLIPLPHAANAVAAPLPAGVTG